MKRVAEPEYRKYQIVRLFQDDLEELLNIFKNICKSTEIVADGYELPDISQLSNIKKSSITDFSLRSYLDDSFGSEWLTLSLTRHKASLYLTDNANASLLGMASQIEHVLTRRKRITRFLISSRARFIGSSILYALFGIIVVPAVSYSWSNGYIYVSRLSNYIIQHAFLMLLALLLVALPLVWSIWAYRVITKKYTIIYLMSFNSQTGFFNRNKDQIILLIIGALLGAIATIIVTLLTK